jgi:hypothetical protein
MYTCQRTGTTESVIFFKDEFEHELSLPQACRVFKRPDVSSFATIVTSKSRFTNDSVALCLRYSRVASANGESS